MDTREIQKLIDFISKSDLSEVNIETSELKLQIKRNGNSPVQYVAAPVFEAVAPQNETVAAPVREAVAAAPVETVASTSHLIEIKAPMIGTFYRSGGPGKPNFVEVGDEIASGKVICILEAMKLFNEIESEISGKIVKILVDDATPVEYDQPLFLVDPS
ncbi:acetyl-CoA carboxylase biotin carboxyl carrier protein [Lacihabitans soyangensis]|uniref:Biotin carboxyl carrier protein of acetyl-CoA carboxylase n=1 Tax=Lacihabitans soyangensis TaxID=869394 RepID=A0AAE3H152_9BACT|nr:acetyl-CoA carboxylase biotin carboxyl carrier protein [Lacihabitans soyangensis]MCP9762089.1 acetyl-CoA carboxylase biotin carboxyl carrier protein [Lacihabitans soyangensis]